MSPVKAAKTVTEIYNQALRYARDGDLSPMTPRPGSTDTWLPENVETLQRYADWLTCGGHSSDTVRHIYLPMAGHILSLNHKPSTELNLESDLQKGMDYILAKGLGPDWTHNCRLAMLKFRRYLLNERGMLESQITEYDPTTHTQGLPEWLVSALLHWQHIKQRNWREARLQENIRRFWSGHLRTWRYFVDVCGIQTLNDLTKRMVLDFTDDELQRKRSVRSINSDLRSLRAFLLFLQEQGQPVPHALTRIRYLKEPQSMPKFLTDGQIRLLQEDFERRVLEARGSKAIRNTLLDRASFYVLWQSALRLGELEELRMEDLDLDNRRLFVRKGKGQKDRMVFCSDSTVRSLRAYMDVRGEGPTDHVFLFRNQPVGKDLIRGRIKAAGERVGVHVYPHRLRHTCATQLVNAGCRITSIQKFLGHTRLNSTLTYARAHDQTVAEDYYAAMSSVERRLELVGQPDEQPKTLEDSEREQLLVLAEKLVQPEISTELRMEIAICMRQVLTGSLSPTYRIPAWDHALPASVILV